MLAILVSVSLLLLVNISNAFSACDEIDITFVVDTENVIANTDSVIEFIVSIISDGSSERAGFSVVLYDKVPNNFDIKLVTLDETVSITQRQKAEAQVEHILEAKFNEIIQFSQTSQKGKTIRLLEAFQIGNSQHRPKRDLDYKKKLGLDVKDENVGGSDDDKVYFVFDYSNRLLDNDKTDICTLFEHLNTNQVENNDESIHFLMGQEYTESSIKNIRCGTKKPAQIKWNTFYKFEDDLIFDQEVMEQIYDISCPAVVQAPSFGGSMKLGNHIQWIDIETVMKCHLVYYDFGSKTSQQQLDVTQSYIQVKDYLNDDNTFKKNDYLLTIEKNMPAMEKMGCSAAVVKIVDVKTEKRVYDKGKAKQYQILKLYLTLPKSPMEYLLDCTIHGDMKVDIDDKHVDPEAGQGNGEYSSAYNDEYYGMSIEDAGIEYMDSLSEEEFADYVNQGMQNAITYIEADENINDYYRFMDEYMGYDEMESVYDFFDLSEDDFDMFYDMFENEEIEELYDIYEEYMYYKYGMDLSELPWPSWQGMKDYAYRAKNYVSQKTANTYNYAKSKYNQAKEYGKKKLTQAKDAAVRTWNTGKHYAKKAYNKGKELVKKGYEKTKKFVRDVYNKKLSLRKTHQLAKLAFKGDYSWKKTKSAALNIHGPKGIHIAFQGTGVVTVNYGYAFNFKMSVSFDFDWQIFKGNIHMEVTLHGAWDIMAYANIKIHGQLEVMIKNILNYGHTFTIFVYGVPIIFRPYVALDLKAVMLPIEVYAGIRCTYGQTFAVGYYYDNTVSPKKSYPIKEIKTTTKGCKREFKLNESQNKGKQCPVAQLGFDIFIEPRIGIELYYIINTHIMFQFKIPLRITVPQTELAVCGAVGDFCNTPDKALYASFTVSMKLNCYIAAYIDLSRITSIVKSLFRLVKPKPQKLAKPRGIKFLSVDVMKRKSLGCTKLDGLLTPLNNYYRGECCNGKAIAPPKPVSGQGSQGKQTSTQRTSNRNRMTSDKKRITIPKKRSNTHQRSTTNTNSQRYPKKIYKKKRSTSSSKYKKPYSKRTTSSKRRYSKRKYSGNKYQSKYQKSRKYSSSKRSVYCDKRVGRFRDRRTGRFAKTPKGKVCRKETSSAVAKTGIYCDKRVGRYRSRRTGRFVRTPAGKVCRKSRK